MACNHHTHLIFVSTCMCQYEVHILIPCLKASKEPYLMRLPTSGITFGGILPRQNTRSIKMPNRGATKAELQQQIEELQWKLKESQVVAKEWDRDELENAALREKLEASQNRPARSALNENGCTRFWNLQISRNCCPLGGPWPNTLGVGGVSMWHETECLAYQRVSAWRDEEQALEEVVNERPKNLSTKGEVGNKKEGSGLSIGGGSRTSE